MKKNLLTIVLAVWWASTNAQNLFSNPGFESGNAWWNFQVTSGTATVDYTSTNSRTGTSAAHVAVTTIGTNNWHIQLNAPEWTAVSGNQYRLSFYAKSDQNATVHVAVQSGPPNYSYLSGEDKVLTANADWKLCEMIFTASASGAGASRLNLFLGSHAANYYFDDFQLEDITTTYPPAPTPPTQGAFYTDIYRNLFQELGKSATAIDTKVNAAFQQLFYGDSATQRLYFETESKDMAYILAPDANDIRTEGLSYGMMICVQLDKKDEFDKLWKFSKTYAQHASGPRKGYFAWQLSTTPPYTAKDQNPASDGEEYFATALFFAANRWGNGTGIFNYEQEARQILHDMLHKQRDNGGIVDGITNMFDTTRKQIVFVPQYDNATFTDPSYHLPGFYRLWSLWAEKDNAFWAAAADTSVAFLSRAAHPTSGLVTDYMSFEGTPKTTTFNANSHRFAYDSWRVVGNIGMDVHWFGSQAWALDFNNKALGFFSSQGVNYLSVYEYDGTPISTNNYHSAGHIAMNAAGVLAANQPTTTWPFVNELWNLSIPSGLYRYYDGLLYMLSMLHASGNFKIWKPQDPSGIATVTEAFQGIKIYPNPGKEVKIESSNNDKIVVLNSLGIEIWNGDVNSWNKSETSLTPGVYLVKTVEGPIKESKKFVIE